MTVLPAPVRSYLRYQRRVLVGLDQFINALAGGDPAETMSYRAAVDRAAGSRFACVFCRFLDLFQRDHCGITLAADDRERLIVPAASKGG